MDEMLRKILGQQVQLPDLQKSNVSKLFVLNKANLSRIQPGMYWYDDNTVSQVLKSEKKLKSIVLFVRDNVIYGDSFMQRYMLGFKTVDFFKQVLAQQPEVYYPQETDLQSVYGSLDKINASCKKVQKLKWSKEIYLAEPVSEQKLCWVDMFDGGQGQMSNQSGAYFRLLITYKVK